MQLLCIIVQIGIQHKLHMTNIVYLLCRRQILTIINASIITPYEINKLL